MLCIPGLGNHLHIAALALLWKYAIVLHITSNLSTKLRGIGNTTRNHFTIGVVYPLFVFHAAPVTGGIWNNFHLAGGLISTSVIVIAFFFAFLLGVCLICSRHCQLHLYHTYFCTYWFHKCKIHCIVFDARYKLKCLAFSKALACRVKRIAIISTHTRIV